MKTQYKNIVIILFIFCFTSFLNAQSTKKQNSNIWSATTTSKAIKLLFGNKKIIDDNRVEVIVPKIAENGGAIPLTIKTKIPAKRIAVFSGSSPTALIALWDVHPRSILEYTTKIRMRQTATITVIIEALDGNLYRYEQEVVVAIAGCGGGGGDSSYSSPVRSKSYGARPKKINALRSIHSARPTPNTQGVSHISENIFKEVSTSALSTFSIDVDTASYSALRSFLMLSNSVPPKGFIRTEEMINYFNYDYKEPVNDEPFYINTQVGDSIWNKNSKIIQIGLQTKKIDISTLPASNLVFLLDVSGSMSDENKLPLLVKSLKLLVKQLRAKDRVSIVVYAGSSGLVLDRARGDEKPKIIAALDSLNSGGSTAGGQGIQLAYDIAQKTFMKNGNNRIILASDGDFNIGISSQSALVELIESKRKLGIYLSVLGFGSGNYKDNKMEQIADKGNGNYYYIDTLLEAKKVLVTQMNATLHTVAKDVKIQVEFNPKMVHSYRLVGYENRLLANEDFNDDTKDAGEIGMGHKVTVLYEIIPTSNALEQKIDKLKYQTSKHTNSYELMTVKVRYKEPKENSSKLLAKIVNKSDNGISRTDFEFAQSVAGFAMLLRDSKYIQTLNFTDLIEHAKDSKGRDRDGNRAEFIKMIEKADLLIK